ncbi:MAG: reverse transcriptase domain-containing protein [Acutalibacteraceae bacterium]
MQSKIVGFPCGKAYLPENAPSNEKSRCDSKNSTARLSGHICASRTGFFLYKECKMEYYEGSVHFFPEDMPFMRRVGLEQATEMFLKHRVREGTPFLYDTHQLAAFLQMDRRRLFALTRTIDRQYRVVSLPKKNGGARLLHVPGGQLKSVQRIILRRILWTLPVSSYATAYAPGRTLRQGAAPHVGKRYLLKLDITGFFDNIRFSQVYGAAFSTHRFPRQIGAMLTSLCCHEDVLPQGAPTSPALSNLVMRRFDDYVGEWCAQRGVSYTRYCDDMTFSSDKPLYGVYQKVRYLLEKMGFSLNEDKTRFVTNTCRQTVTGLTVNEKVTVDRQYKRQLRQEVYYALKNGAANAVAYAGRAAFFGEEGVDVHRYRAHLLGRVRYVLQVEPDNVWFEQAFQKLRRL